MYFGSVRFFKHLIMATLSLAVVGGLSVAVYLGTNFIAENTGSGTSETKTAKGTQSGTTVRLGKSAVNADETEGSADAIEASMAEETEASMDDETGADMAEGEIGDSWVDDGTSSTHADTDTTGGNSADMSEASNDNLTSDKPANTKTTTLTASAGSAVKHADLVEYATLFPELYAEPSEMYVKGEGYQNGTSSKNVDADKRIAYLTFDDGPSEVTSDVMAVLRRYDVKATFFINNPDTEKKREILAKILSEGHAVGMHSMTHDYKKIYKSVPAFLEDMNGIFTEIYMQTGMKPAMMRFPGGSINAYDKPIYEQLAAEVLRRGFVYYDWNVTIDNSGDTNSYNNSLHNVESRDSVIIQMQDGPDKTNMPYAVKYVIENLRDRGYAFDKLSEWVKPVTFAYE